MNIIFSKEGSRSLRFAWAALALALAAAAGLAWGSHWYLEKEKRDGVASKGRLSQAQARVDAAKRERDDLRASSEVYQNLVGRGIFQEESRLDVIERLDRLKTQHKLLGLEYDIAPQRPLPLPGGRVFDAVDILGSRVKVRVMALHEGDALAFLEDLARPPKGFVPIHQCTLRRIEAEAADQLSARVQADCVLEWISLKDKRGRRAG